MSEGDVLTPENRVRIDELATLRARYRLKPHVHKPILFRPCEVRILMVADSFLYFSDEEFGLSDLIGTLATPPGPYVRFELTCAHRASVADAQVAVGNPNVARSIKNFRFDDPDHFTPNMYEEVWLFGAETSFPSDGRWQNAPGDSELRALSEFMDGGGGLFATGDHGALGAALCGFVPRVRSMRMWFAQPGPNNEPAAPDMNSPERNDTNRPGRADPVTGSVAFDFDDQSDDIPQRIQPTPYSRKINRFLQAVFPHPLLCGPRGPIRVLPDHPHEGACIPAYELDREFDFDGYRMMEYPPAAGPQPRPMPEIVATSSVLAGNNVKLAAFPQEFGAIGAYDGELAGVGRVSVDATWHHFININLTGRNGDPTDPKTQGFLASATGRAHYEDIKAYFRNIAVWLAPTASRRCMRRCGIWAVLWDHRLLEAVTPGIPIRLYEATVDQFLAVGRHARDALGKLVGRCRSLEWGLDLLKPIVSWEIYERLRPWPPWPPSPDPVPWLDEEPLLDLALGGGVVALRDAFPDGNEVNVPEAEERMLDVLEEGARRGLQVAADSAELAARRLGRLSQGLRRVRAESFI